MNTRHRLLLLLFLLAGHLTGCRPTKGVPDERHNAELVAPPVGVDTVKSWELRVKSEPLVKPALLPRLTDAIGLSTPAGRARRQARKDAAATVPRSIGKGAVYAVNATVASGFKSAAPATTAAAGATVSNAAANSQQQAVRGDGNELHAKQANPQTAAPGFWTTLVDNLTGPLGYVLAGAVVLVLLAWRARRNNPMA